MDDIKSSMIEKGIVIDNSTSFLDYGNKINEISASSGLNVSGKTTVSGLAKENISAGDTVGITYSCLPLVLLNQQ